MKTVILTHQMIEAGRSRHGGWSAQQLALFGLTWPLKKGWKRHLAGHEFPKGLVDEFVRLKDAHLKKP